MSVSDSFEYKSLQPGRNIRLLRPEETGNGFILEEFQLDSCPQFDAISYRWDQERELHDVLINGRIKRVSQNCKTAMSDRLHVAYGWGYRFLHFWVDAVCIDQSNFQERNHQVSLMADIYKRAERTVVWLGDALDNSNFSLDIRAGVEAGIFEMNTILEEGRRDSAHPMGLKLDQPERYREMYEVTRRLEALLERSWFTRIWVIQEVALAKEIVVGCVNARFSWDDLVKAVRALSRTQGNVSKSVFDAPIKIVDARNQYRATGNIDLERILSLSRTFDCTELRDKVYGMLGLNDELAEAIGLPDYEKPLPEVWADLARAILSKLSVKALFCMTADIDLVEIKREQTEDETSREPGWLAEMDRVDVRRRLKQLQSIPPLPSWAPNLQNPQLPWPMNSRVVDEAYGSPVISFNGLNLHLKAAFVDKIDEVSTWSTSGSNAEMHSTWNQWLEEAGSLDPYQRPQRHPEEANMRYLDNEGLPMEVVFWRTVFCDIDNKITDTPQLMDWHRWFCLEMSMNLLLFDSRLLSDRDSEVWMSPGGFPMNIATLRNSTRHKALFSTEKILFGLGPRGLRKGDDVAFFLGYNVPFILRAVAAEERDHCPEGHLVSHDVVLYQIVGPVFIHGLMNAERVIWSDLEWRDVIII
ncbi:HET-domain-containing protein [Coniochaeta sp. PMI_546]|nr:HET-domain-containing protein [Coniochaeta sp. PMI_546]